MYVRQVEGKLYIVMSKKVWHLSVFILYLQNLLCHNCSLLGIHSSSFPHLQTGFCANVLIFILIYSCFRKERASANQCLAINTITMFCFVLWLGHSMKWICFGINNFFVRLCFNHTCLSKVLCSILRVFFLDSFVFSSIHVSLI